MNIAGVQYGDYQQCSNFLRPGVELELYHEVSNPYDDRAVKIMYHGFKLGYIPIKEEVLIDEMFEHKSRAAKFRATLLTYNKTNPTWAMFVVKIEVQKNVKPKGDEERF